MSAILEKLCDKNMDRLFWKASKEFSSYKKKLKKGDGSHLQNFRNAAYNFWDMLENPGMRIIGENTKPTQAVGSTSDGVRFVVETEFGLLPRDDFEFTAAMNFVGRYIPKIQEASRHIESHGYRMTMPPNDIWFWGEKGVVFKSRLIIFNSLYEFLTAGELYGSHYVKKLSYTLPGYFRERDGVMALYNGRASDGIEPLKMVEAALAKSTGYPS